MNSSLYIGGQVRQRPSQEVITRARKLLDDHGKGDRDALRNLLILINAHGISCTDLGLTDEAMDHTKQEILEDGH